MKREPREYCQLVEHARELQFQGELDRSRAIFEQLIEDDPDDCRAVIGLAELHTLYGLHDQALRLYQRAYDLFVARGRLVHAVLAWARGRPPYHPESLAWVASKYLEMGLWDEGEALYRNLAARLDEIGSEHGAACVRRILRHLAPPDSGVM